jgi:signal transduction histidine kinase
VTAAVGLSICIQFSMLTLQVQKLWLGILSNKQKLHDGERLAVVTTLVQSLSHSVGTPLGNARMASSYLLEHEKELPDESFVENLMLIDKSLAIASSMVLRFRDMIVDSKNPFRMEEANLVTSLNQYMEHLRDFEEIRDLDVVLQGEDVPVCPINIPQFVQSLALILSRAASLAVKPNPGNPVIIRIVSRDIGCVVVLENLTWPQSAKEYLSSQYELIEPDIFGDWLGIRGAIESLRDNMSIQSMTEEVEGFGLQLNLVLPERSR